MEKNDDDTIKLLEQQDDEKMLYDFLECQIDERFEC